MAERMLHPLEIGDIFDTAFELYKDNFILLTLVAAVSAVPLSIATALVTLHFTRNVVQLSSILSSGVPEIASALSSIGVLLQSVVLFAPLFLLGHGLQMTALASATSTRYLGERATLSGTYLFIFKHFAPFAVTALLYGLATGLGIAFCYVGIIVPLTMYVFTAHAFAVEGQAIGYWHAMKRSSGLVSGSGGRVFGTLCILLFVYSVLSIGMTFPLKLAIDTLLQIVPGGDHIFGGGAVAASVFSVKRQVVEQISGGIASIILAPFLVSVITVLYFDLRLRKEAFDIALLARSLHYPDTACPPLPLLTGGRRG